MSPEEAIEIIGNMLAHPNLRCFNQREVLTGLQAHATLKEYIGKTRKCEQPQPSKSSQPESSSEELDKPQT